MWVLFVKLFSPGPWWLEPQAHGVRHDVSRAINSWNPAEIHSRQDGGEIRSTIASTRFHVSEFKADPTRGVHLVGGPRIPPL